MDKNDSIKYIEKKTYITNPITGEEKLYTVRAAIPEDQKNHAKFLLDAIGYKNSPRFKVGDKIYSTHNPLIKYEILEVGVPNELGTLDYRAKNISDDKTYRGIERLMEISKVDEWGELISPQWTEEDESYYKSVLWHVSNSISNGKETNVKSDLTVWLEKLKNRLSN